ncbi:Vicilin-like seed storage protein [Camellia lanceoleosa]|uniref:Vicilin-like seed storage protein n=1 Tax=Camellia lanceoleosa TaxID=1840588 RepID=A0ACC0HT84_9ERIC|nr:Vicilin-like seed storage protein [Camellia lanceoleosa]
MLKKYGKLLVLFLICLRVIVSVRALGHDDDDHHEGDWSAGSVVRKDERKSVVSTEYGEISAVEISDGVRGGGRYHLQFITLEPDALFLPVLLHADMVFYVHSGGGRLSWVDEDEMRRVNLRRGDVYRMQPGTVFFVQSNLEPERQKLRIYAIFTNSIDNLREPNMGVYSRIHDLILGFDNKVLQAAFMVPEDVIEELTRGAMLLAIVHAPPRKERTLWELEAQFMKALLGSRGYSMFDTNNKKYKAQVFNILKADPDFENCNGRSLMVTKKQLPALRGSKIGIFMVNLTRGSMMGPHWNPMASEISIVIQGQGMVRVVCSSTMNESGCRNMSFRVGEGDVFVVPRFHPMAQMAFNNESFVFMGFSTTTKKNHPQFLAGKASVLRTLDQQVVAASFGVANMTISHLLDSQGESIILDCISCAEEEERMMEKEIEKEREEAREREEEEARKREEEKKREEEEEEARRREEEEAKKEEEEKRRKEEEEEARKRGEEEARREEEAARKREEEQRRQEQEEEEEARKREEEEEEKRRREEEETRKREKEEQRREKEEEARKREEEQARREEEEARRQEEEEARRKEEETARREEDEARKREEEEARRQEEEDARRREQEEEARRKVQKREQEEERRRREAAEREEEEAKRQEQEREEMEKRQEKDTRERERQEEEARRQEQEEEEGGGKGE